MAGSGGVDIANLRALVRSRQPVDPIADPRTCEPGPELAAAMADRIVVREVDGHRRVDLQHLSGDELIDLMAATARQATWAEAVQLATVNELAHRRPHLPGGWRRDPTDLPYWHSEFATDEISVALRISGQAARRRLEIAYGLTRLPGTTAALLAGRIDSYRAQVIVDGLCGVTLDDAGDAAAARIEADVLTRAGDQTAAALRRSVRRAVLRHDPAAVAQREKAARTERHVELCPAADGMAWLSALLPAVDATACWQRLTTLVHATSPADDTADDASPDKRGIDERRADTLVDLLLGRDTTTAPAVAVQVQVTVPAATVTGASDAPAELAGYGPISADTARRLLGAALADPGLDTSTSATNGSGPADNGRDASTDVMCAGWPQTWRRLLTDPVSGALLDVGQRTYRPPVAIDRHVQLRDRHCRFPGCRQPATRCDRDHVTRYPDGPTAVHNLASAVPTPPPAQARSRLAGAGDRQQRRAALDHPHRPPAHHPARAARPRPTRRCRAARRAPSTLGAPGRRRATLLNRHPAGRPAGATTAGPAAARRRGAWQHARMPEGHVTHRLAHRIRERFGGRPTRSSSPQGRFAVDAAELDGHVLDSADAVGKHLFVWFGARAVHVHLGQAGRLRFADDDERPIVGVVRWRLANDRCTPIWSARPCAS